MSILKAAKLVDFSTSRKLDFFRRDNSRVFHHQFSTLVQNLVPKSREKHDFFSGWSKTGWIHVSSVKSMYIVA